MPLKQCAGRSLKSVSPKGDKGYSIKLMWWRVTVMLCYINLYSSINTTEAKCMTKEAHASPGREVSQKSHLAEFLNKWLRWFGIDKREDIFNVPDVFRGNESIWSIWIHYPKYQKQEPYDHELSGCYFQMAQSTQPGEWNCPFYFENPCLAWA